MEEFAEEQKKLAQAQARTEVTVQNFTIELRKLDKAFRETNKQLCGLSEGFGHIHANKAYKALPALLKRDHGILIKGRLKREYVKDKDGEYIEVDISGSARQNGKGIVIVGESKSKLSKNDVNDFIRKKLKRLEGVYPDFFPVLLTHMTSSHDVEKYVKDKGIVLYYSYDF
jgi:RecG-like helicase